MDIVNLSICIPTYNRSEYLRECLTSIVTSANGHERNIEIVISDNASEDNTAAIVKEFQKRVPYIRYHRNPNNIGGELNFRFVASLAIAEFVWVFGDDDKMELNAISTVLEKISAGHDFLICNYSIWDKNFTVKIRDNALPEARSSIFDDHNKLLEFFGLHLGYISSIIIKKKLLLDLPYKEYESYKEYGFPYLLAVYNGVAMNTCKIKFIANPIICNRSGNSGNYDWYKFFVTGSSLIFDALLAKGYKKKAVRTAKRHVLNTFVLPSLIGIRLRSDDLDNFQNAKLLFVNYRNYWQFWLQCLPRLLVPLYFYTNVAKLAHKFTRLKKLTTG